MGSNLAKCRECSKVTGMSRLPQIVCLLSISFFTIALSAEPKANHRLGFAGKRADGVSEKRVEPKAWNGSTQNSQLLQKTFPMTEWDKHFSSLGSKRSPIDLAESKEKSLFKTKTKTYPEKEYEMSRWNERMKDLQQEARLVSEPDTGTLKKATDEKLYSMVLQDTQKYADMAEELSLRDLNKFQFRRNHSDGDVPVQKAGSE